MSAWRLPSGDAIDRSRPFSFSFDGQRIEAFSGDTIASALLANDVRIVGRSFKYHRPRGVWGAWVEEPNAIVDVSGGSRPAPNVRATTEPAEAGTAVRSVNAAPNARADRNAFLDRFSRFIPAAFYYKTFMWPGWRSYEPRIRAMAGLGRIDPEWRPTHDADQINRNCDVLVVGGGPAGLAAALAAIRTGQSVILVDDRAEFGGSLLHRSGKIDRQEGGEWASRAVAELIAAGATLLSRTTAYGIYDHDLTGLNQRHIDGRPDTLWRVRPKEIVLATGAIERPLPFAANDLPGIMSADAALTYLRRYGVACGRRIVVATNNNSAYEPALALAESGAEITVVDSRRGRNRMPEAHALQVLQGRSIARARGRPGVCDVVLDDGAVLPADAVLVSGGWTPTIHLFCQAKGKLVWSDEAQAFLPGAAPRNIRVAGAAAGAYALSDVIGSGFAAIEGYSGAGYEIPKGSGPRAALDIEPAWPTPGMKGRVWIDYQSDVTTKDVELAARENFVSVEHLKRYTTLGMATDQGKTSNLNGLALLAEITGRPVEAVGTTTYRPPFTPVPFTSFAGSRHGVLFAPVRRLPLETRHRRDGAVFQEYGGWLRPAYFGKESAPEAIQREAHLARETVALFDGSPLGKIEVIGPKAAEFLDFIYYNTVSTLKPGRLRYGFMLSESGVVYDDGVVARIDENRFIVSCSSSHVAGVHARLEEWRQDRFDKSKVFIHNATPDQATLTVSGPRSRHLVEQVGLGVSLKDADLPHMALAAGSFEGTPVRVARVSFTGDRSYEISIRADRAEPLSERMKREGEGLDAVTIGIEALMILRAEKGYIVIGKDTDGTTMPHDLGVTAPREKRTGEYVGRRSLFTAEAQRTTRRQLVGLSVPAGKAPLPTGAHAVERAGGKTRSTGYVTSSYFSPSLERPIALGLIERGRERVGEQIEIQHLGEIFVAIIADPCAFDKGGERIDA